MRLIYPASRQRINLSRVSGWIVLWIHRSSKVRSRAPGQIIARVKLARVRGQQIGQSLRAGQGSSLIGQGRAGLSDSGLLNRAQRIIRGEGLPMGY
jgi:hypothetical protein